MEIPEEQLEVFELCLLSGVGAIRRLDAELAKHDIPTVVLENEARILRGFENLLEAWGAMVCRPLTTSATSTTQ